LDFKQISWDNILAIFLKPLILRARSARKIKGFRKMAKVLPRKNLFFEKECGFATLFFKK